MCGKGDNTNDSGEYSESVDALLLSARFFEIARNKTHTIGLPELGVCGPGRVIPLRTGV